MAEKTTNIVGLIWPLLDGPHPCEGEPTAWDDNDPIATKLDTDEVNYFLFTTTEAVKVFLPMAAKSMGISHMKVKCIRVDEDMADELLELVDQGKIVLSIDPIPDENLSGAIAQDIIPHPRGTS